jgi:ribosome-binding factor A
MESTRQKKVSRQVLKDLSEIFQLEGRDIIGTSFVSVTVVRVSPDLSVARVYVSVFGIEDKEGLLDKINSKGNVFRKKLGIRVKNQMRKVPELKFFLDDSVDYSEQIEDLLNDNKK